MLTASISVKKWKQQKLLHPKFALAGCAADPTDTDAAAVNSSQQSAALQNVGFLLSKLCKCLSIYIFCGLHEAAFQVFSPGSPRRAGSGGSGGSGRRQHAEQRSGLERDQQELLVHCRLGY